MTRCHFLGAVWLFTSHEITYLFIISHLLKVGWLRTLLTLAILQMLHARHIFKHPNLCFFYAFYTPISCQSKFSFPLVWRHSSGQGCACMLPIAAATLILVLFLRTPVCTCLALVMLELAGSGLAVVFMSPADGLRRHEVDVNSGERSQACGQMLSA